MCQFYNEKIVNKPRKPHKCFGCRKVLPVNKKHYYTTGKFEGEFFASRICFACKNHLEKFRSNFEDGFCEGDVYTDRIETINQWKYFREQKCK